MSRVIRPGTAEYVEIDDRIRSCIVTGVTDQDTIEVRLGGASSSTSTTYSAARQPSTATRATLFVAS
jgi:hypothetical protein